MSASSSTSVCRVDALFEEGDRLSHWVWYAGVLSGGEGGAATYREDGVEATRREQGLVIHAMAWVSDGVRSMRFRLLAGRKKKERNVMGIRGSMEQVMRWAR